MLNNEEDADDALLDAFCRLLLWKEDTDTSLAGGMAVVDVKGICISR